VHGSAVFVRLILATRQEGGARLTAAAGAMLAAGRPRRLATAADCPRRESVFFDCLTPAAAGHKNDGPPYLNAHDKMHRDADESISSTYPQ